MSLTVVPQGVSDLYQLNLSLSSLSAGTYTVYMADGSSRSGQVTFAVSANIFKPTSTAAKDGAGEDANADPAAATTPVWPTGDEKPGSSISSTTSTSMSSGGGWMSDSSSSSS
jgi:hypothetical protein